MSKNQKYQPLTVQLSLVTRFQHSRMVPIWLDGYSKLEVISCKSCQGQYNIKHKKQVTKLEVANLQNLPAFLKITSRSWLQQLSLFLVAANCYLRQFFTLWTTPLGPQLFECFKVPENCHNGNTSSKSSSIS